MIYIVSRKYLEKKIRKLAAACDYVIIDGENYGVTGNDCGGAKSLSSQYNNTKSVGNLCPEVRFYELLRRSSRGEYVASVKMKAYAEDFFLDERFDEGVNICLKAFSIGAQKGYVNIFVSIPDIVYTYLGESIYRKFVEAVGGRKIVFNQGDLKDDKKLHYNKASTKDILEVTKIADRKLQELELIAKRREAYKIQAERAIRNDEKPKKKKKHKKKKAEYIHVYCDGLFDENTPIDMILPDDKEGYWGW